MKETHHMLPSTISKGKHMLYQQAMNKGNSSDKSVHNNTEKGQVCACRRASRQLLAVPAIVCPNRGLGRLTPPKLVMPAMCFTNKNRTLVLECYQCALLKVTSQQE